ncbi:MAG TPA: tetratricopeptide repeat protein [Planctomycetota bacterium]|nr:tetratricopeptide repeat protein [Planctomycetota bacterium]
MRAAGILAAAVACAAVAGCAGGAASRTAGRSAFWQYDYAAAQKLFAESQDRLDRNYVLYNLEVGSAAFEGGNYYAARTAFERAAQVMRGYGGNTQGIISLIANESAKLYKGDPYEQAMANFYDGLVYYRWGDWRNARAAFHQALMADQSSAEGNKEDFAVAQFMIGKCYLKLGEPDNARISFEKAREKYPNNPYFSDDAINSHNVLLIIQLGRAPVKTQTGLAGSNDVYEGGRYRETGATVCANGKLLGQSALAVDLLDQAQASGRSAKDTIQTIKGGIKTGLMAAGAQQMSDNRGAAGPLMLLAGLLMPAQADIRNWDLLPGEVHVLSAKLEPGSYTFKIDFLDGSTPLLDYRQVWFHVPVNADGETVLFFRSGREKANGNFPPPQSPKFGEAPGGSSGATATEGTP